MATVDERQHSLAALLASDHEALRGRPYGRLARLRSCAAFLFDPRLRACMLLRLTIALPGFAKFLPRHLLIGLHRMDCLLPISIGPGLRLPHPTGVVVGRVRAGEGLTLDEYVTFGGARPGLPELEVGDNVTVGARSTVLVDELELLPDSVIDADQFVYSSAWTPAAMRRRANAGDAPPATPADARIPRLLYADYVAAGRRRVRKPVDALVMMAYFLTNPSLHACALLRLGGDHGVGPKRLWRALLRAKHGIELQDGVSIGGGIYLPHPMEIVFGAGTQIGPGARLGQRVRFEPALDGPPTVLGDEVFIFPACTIAAGSQIGDQAIIAAHSEVAGTLKPKAVFRSRRPSRPGPMFVPARTQPDSVDQPSAVTPEAKSRS